MVLREVIGFELTNVIYEVEFQAYMYIVGVQNFSGYLHHVNPFSCVIIVTAIIVIHGRALRENNKVI